MRVSTGTGRSHVIRLTPVTENTETVMDSTPPRRVIETPADGKYWATCRERNELSAALNGHGDVFPQARMTVIDGWVFFYRNGEEVWNCNARCAAANFIVRPA